MGGLTIAPSLAYVRIAPGDRVDVRVAIRNDSKDAPTTVLHVDGLPPGVTAADVSVPAAASEATVTIVAASDAPVGVDTRALVRAQSGRASFGAEITVVLHGPSGALDASFGKNGVVTGPQIGSENSFHAVTVDAFGRVVAAGYGSDPPDEGRTRIVVVRYTADGKPDATFGKNGVAVARFEPTAFPNAIAIDAQSRVIVAGYVDATRGRNVIGLARFLGNGDADATFGANGVAQLDFGSRDERPSALLLDQGGGATVVGFSCRDRCSRQVDYDVLFTRVDAKGKLDARFGNDGVAYVDIGPGRDFATRALRQADGKIVVAGYTNARARLGRGYDFFALRALADGTPDPTFGERGVVVTDVGESDTAHALAIDPSGRIVVGGETSKRSDVLASDLALVRYTKEGALDATFGRGGVAIVDLDGGEDQIYGLAIEPDGRMTGAGFTRSKNDTRAALSFMRFTNAGALDAAFAGRGYLFVHAADAGEDFGTEAATAPGGRFVVAGSTSLTGKAGAGIAHFTVARLWL